MSNYKWYALQVKSGSERSALATIENNLRSFEQSDEVVEELFLPLFGEQEGKKKKRGDSKLMSGYLFVKMDMQKANLSKVFSGLPNIRFLGSSAGGVAQPISDSEISKIKNNIDNLSVEDDLEFDVQVGDEVKIIDGPFNSFVGKVEYIDEGKRILRVLIVIFGRSTPIDLEVNKVERVK